MKKKIFSFILALTLMFGLSTTLVGCKDKTVVNTFNLEIIFEEEGASSIANVSTLARGVRGVNNHDENVIGEVTCTYTYTCYPDEIPTTLYTEKNKDKIVFNKNNFKSDKFKNPDVQLTDSHPYFELLFKFTNTSEKTMKVNAHSQNYYLSLNNFHAEFANEDDDIYYLIPSTLTISQSETKYFKVKFAVTDLTKDAQLENFNEVLTFKISIEN